MYREGQVLDIVGLGPPELIGQLPGNLTKSAVGARSNQAAIERCYRSQGVRARNVASPECLRPSESEPEDLCCGSLSRGDRTFHVAGPHHGRFRARPVDAP